MCFSTDMAKGICHTSHAGCHARGHEGGGEARSSAAGGHGSIWTRAPAHLEQLPPHTHWPCVLHGLQRARPLIKKDDGGPSRRAHANLARGKLERLRPRAPRPRSPEARERQCGKLARLGGILPVVIYTWRCNG